MDDFWNRNENIVVSGKPRNSPVNDATGIILQHPFLGLKPTAKFI